MDRSANGDFEICLHGSEVMGENESDWQLASDYDRHLDENGIDVHSTTKYA